MTIPTLLGTGGHQSIGQNFNNPYYYSNVGLGRSAMIGNVTAESNASRPIRAAGTISYLSWGVEDDGGFGADLTLALRKGISASALSVSIPSSTTGWVTDSAHTISVSSGDVLDFATHLSGSTTSSSSFYCVSARFDASTGSAQMLTTFGPSNISPLTTREFVNFQGILDGGTNVEGNHQFYCLADGTWKNLACTLESNGFNRSSVVTNRINGSNGSMSVSIPASTSGSYEDTSNGDSVDVGDYLNYSIIGAPLAGAGSFRMDWVGAHFVADDANLCMIGGSQGGGQLVAATSTKFSSLFGGGSVPIAGSGSTARATGLLPYDLMASKFTNLLSSAAGTATFTLLVDGSPSDLVTSASSSGYWTDNTHTVQIDAGHTCANQIEVDTGSVTWASAALLLEAS